MVRAHARRPLLARGAPVSAPEWCECPTGCKTQSDCEELNICLSEAQDYENRRIASLARVTVTREGGSRYQVAKESGSHLARVVDTTTGVVVARYNIFRTYARLDGWSRAIEYAKRMNSKEPT